VAGGLVWGGEIAGGRDSGEFVGRNPQTGEIVSRFLPDIDIYFMHQRCYRSKATEQWLIPGWTGTEFVDFRNEHWITNHWVRSGCIYGVMPCNGLLYTTPHDCACYMQAKLFGFCALAAKRSPASGVSDNTSEQRLERGPAYGETASSRTAPSSQDWPTYRRDAQRRGSTDSQVSAQLNLGWQTKLAGRLTSPVVAAGQLYVASIDTHTVHALDAVSGEARWSFTTGARVDSPPTVAHGRVLFGSADGHVYCLRASDGELVWRFRAAPYDQRMTSFEQLESVWPVSGSVLVQDGTVYCIVGRSMFLDGGLRLLTLDAASGRLLGERVLDERDPASGDNLQKYVEVRNMPVGLPDILSSDGKRLYMRSQVMDLEGNRTKDSLTQAKGSDANRAAVQQGDEAHLFSPTGFLDDTWWHRSYWVYGRSFAEGAGGWHQAGKVAPSGRILAVDDDSVYGFGRKPFYYQWRTPLEYHLFATPRVPEIVKDRATVEIARRNQKQRPMTQHPQYHWSRPVPMLVRALVKAGDKLFIAGPPDVLDEEEAFRRVPDPNVDAKLAAQEAAMVGANGALLWAVSASTGERLAEQKLDRLPLFDGLVAAQGRLYLVTEDGVVMCYQGT
jgi:outer membrane protein assembly factor BamB